MDFYKSIENLKNNFVKFINKTPSFGKSFICLDNQNNKDILKKISNMNYHTYGIDKKSNYNTIHKCKELS